jgi:hypothetical protein
MAAAGAGHAALLSATSARSGSTPKAVSCLRCERVPWEVEAWPIAADGRWSPEWMRIGEDSVNDLRAYFAEQGH